MDEKFLFKITQSIKNNTNKSFQFFPYAQITRNYKPEVTPHSRWLSLFDGCQQKLGVKNLRRVKGNLTTRTVFHRRAGMHIDYPNMTTSILYVNTNNGGTRFKNGEFIKSVANRLITFDSNLEHEGVSCTDKKTRVVVNFNYEKY